MAHGKRLSLGILVKSISRFARNTKECLECIRELRELGISVFFEEHNIDTRMVTSEVLTAVLASCAQAESEYTIRNRQMLWGADIIELNKRISDIISQSHKLTVMQKSGNVDPDIFIAKSNRLAEQLRQAKQQKERLQYQEDDGIIEATEQLLEAINAGPAMLESFDEELFCELIDKVIVESNTKIRFRLKNGLELPETIERTVR